MDLSWDAVTVEGGGTYKVYRDGVEVGTPTTNSYTDSTLTTATTYLYQVTAVGPTDLESAKSNEVSVTTL